MSYKLILAWVDDDEDTELVSYPLPVTVGEHQIDKILVGHRGRTLDVTLKASVVLRGTRR